MAKLNEVTIGVAREAVIVFPDRTAARAFVGGIDDLVSYSAMQITGEAAAFVERVNAHTMTEDDVAIAYEACYRLNESWFDEGESDDV